MYVRNRESLSKKSLALYIDQMLFEILFSVYLNVPSMKDFHLEENQESLCRMLFLFLDY